MKYRRLYPKDKTLITMMLGDSVEEQRQMRIVEFLENDQNFFVAAISRQKIVGYIAAYKLQRFDGQNSMMYVHDIDVSADFRRQGVGRQLLKVLKRICTNEKISKMFLVTNESNAIAMAYYQSESATRLADDDVVFEFKDFLN